MLRTNALRQPHKEALVHKEDRVDYETLWRRTAGLAAGLRDAGVKRCDRVGVLLEPSTALATSLLGVPRAGGVFVPIHHSLLADQVEHIVRDCSMTGFITDVGRLGLVEQLAAACPSLKLVVVVGGEGPRRGEWQQLDFDSLCAHHVDALDDVAIGKDLAAILYTSGSTGKPKGVMLSHANVIAGAEIVADYLDIGPEDRTLAVLPFSFDAGLNQLMTALLHGATCVMTSFLFAKEIVTQLQKERITGLAGVPSLWNLLAQKTSRLADTPLPHLRYISNTGGALPLNVLEKLRAAVPDTKSF
jgi:acyl-CoA synthetase (AMP-forming)/AMP-acid ligase II